MSAILLLVLLLVVHPADAGEHGGKRDRSGAAAEKRRIALSIRIAEARNRPGAKKYFQSVARQQKAHRRRAPDPRQID